MKVAVLGASGWVGSHVLSELQQRNIETLALVRDVSKAEHITGDVRILDLQQQNTNFASLLDGVDILVVSVVARSENNHDTFFADTATRLLAAIPRTGVCRLIWVGGAGSLEVAPGVLLRSIPEFPEEYQQEALGQEKALDIFRTTADAINWTVVSPAADLFQGEKQGHYQVAGDQLPVDEAGNSRISAADFALALVDEIAEPRHEKQRFSVAY